MLIRQHVEPSISGTASADVFGFHPAPQWEFTAVHAVNFVAYVLALASIGAQWPLLVPTGAVFVAYALLHFEGRYIAAYVVTCGSRCTEPFRVQWNRSGFSPPSCPRSL